MKKNILAVFAMLAIIYISAPVKADTITAPSNYDWLDWAHHDYTWPDSPLYGYTYANSPVVEGDVTNVQRAVGFYEERDDEAEVSSDKCFLVGIKNTGYKGDIARVVALSKSQNMYTTGLIYVNGNTALEPTYTKQGFVINTADQGSSNSAEHLIPGWNTYFPNSSGYYFLNVIENPISSSARNNIYDIQCDVVVEDAEELYNFLVQNDWKPPAETPETGKMPYFYLKITSPAIVKNVEYTITWDTRGSFVEGHEDDYGISVYIADNAMNDTGGWFTDFKHKKAVRDSDMYPVMFNQTAFSFTFGQLEDMYPWNGGFLSHSFYIYVKITDSQGTPVNSKWVDFHVVKIYELNGSSLKTTDEEGNFTSSESLTEREDGVTDYTDGRPQGDDKNANGEKNSNGSQVSPDASEKGISNYNPTQPQQNGIDYGTSLGSLKENLVGLVSLLQNIPVLVSTTMSFFPAWVINIIAVSIGMLVVIGTVKFILK